MDRRKTGWLPAQTLGLTEYSGQMRLATTKMDRRKTGWLLAQMLGPTEYSG